MIKKERKNPTREMLVEVFITALEEKGLLWEKSWDCDIPYLGSHLNTISGKQYSGLNAVLLWLQSMRKGYKDNRWVTFAQAKKEGWKVRKDEKSTPVEYWYVFDVKESKVITFAEMDKIISKNKDRALDMKPRFNTYRVFNAAQIEGMPTIEKGERKPIVFTNKELDKFLSNYMLHSNLKLEIDASSAYYSPTKDVIGMPPKENFHSEIEFYDTMFHECAHSTGHTSRLDRPISLDRKSDEYATEELRAEIASAFIMAGCGITVSKKVLDNNRAYVKGWVERIKEEPTPLFSAIKDAGKISDYVLAIGNIEKIKEQNKSRKEIEVGVAI